MSTLEEECVDITVFNVSGSSFGSMHSFHTHTLTHPGDTARGCFVDGKKGGKRGAAGVGHRLKGRKVKENGEEQASFSSWCVAAVVQTALRANAILRVCLRACAFACINVI